MDARNLDRDVRVRPYVCTYVSIYVRTLGEGEGRLPGTSSILMGEFMYEHKNIENWTGEFMREYANFIHSLSTRTA